MKHRLETLPFSNSFASLAPDFYSRVKPTPFSSTSKLIHANPAAAELLHLDNEEFNRPEFVEVFSGKQLHPQSDPLAMLYCGHQFGHLVPQLGDGRAILLGETTTPQGNKWEMQLKGSGLTPYSRDGDGRAVLRSTIREYLCSEAMHGLGIPTTRALCIIGSDDEVYREKIEPGAMLTRLAPSHVRFGSFEVFYYRNQFSQLKTLADYVIEHHYPHLQDHSQKYLAWFEEVIQRTAQLIAHWQAVGFAHGVMNSDNMSILGLTLDYGPFGFMEAYQPSYICNHSDYQGRYAFDQQPNIGLFNLSCFAQAILPLLDEVPETAAEQARDQLAKYQHYFISAYAQLMRAKLGLRETRAEDQHLINDLLKLMARDSVDFTILFRRLANFSSQPGDNNAFVRDLFLRREAFDQWADRYQTRLRTEQSNDAERQQRIQMVNPKYILRNYLAEMAIRKAEDERDYSEIDRLFKLLQNPYAEQPEFECYADFPPDWAQTIAVSCSS